MRRSLVDGLACDGDGAANERSQASVPSATDRTHLSRTAAERLAVAMLAG